MNRESYELLAYIARYWFALLAALVVWRAWRATVRDNRKDRTLRDWEGGAGCVGELVLTNGGSSRRRAQMTRFPVPQEGVIGYGARADIRLRGRGIRRKHIYMTYSPGLMTLHPVGKAEFDAPTMDDGTRGLRDGDRLKVGDSTLMMVFFDTADARPSDRKITRPRQVLPEDVSEDEFEDVWE